MEMIEQLRVEVERLDALEKKHHDAMLQEQGRRVLLEGEVERLKLDADHERALAWDFYREGLAAADKEVSRLKAELEAANKHLEIRGQMIESHERVAVACERLTDENASLSSALEEARKALEYLQEAFVGVGDKWEWRGIPDFPEWVSAVLSNLAVGKPALSHITTNKCDKPAPENEGEGKNS